MEKLTSKQIGSVIEVQNILLFTYPDYRTGQALFNALHSLYPEVANEIKGTDVDPYYSDQNIAKCIKHISE